MCHYKKPTSMNHLLNLILIYISFLTFSCKNDDPMKTEIMVVAEEASTGVFQLFTRNINGTNPKQLTFNQFKSFMPAISPNGDYIAYVIESNFSADIYLIKSDGTDNHKITNGGVNITPYWTSNGEHILFSYSTNPGNTYNSKIYRMKADGTQKSVLINDTCNCSELAPTVSPDGQFVAFGSNRSGAEEYEIWKVNIAGNDLTKLTTVEYDSDIQANIQQKVPAWSPDGTKIALWRGVEMTELQLDGSIRDQKIIQSWKICVMNADGSNLTAIDFGDDPTWSNDSKYVIHPDPMNRDMNANNQISIKKHLPDGGDNITLFKTAKNFGRMDIGYTIK